MWLEKVGEGEGRRVTWAGHAALCGQQGGTLAFAPSKVGAVEGSEQEGQDLTRCSQAPFGTLWTD